MLILSKTFTISIHWQLYTLFNLLFINFIIIIIIIVIAIVIVIVILKIYLLSLFQVPDYSWDSFYNASGF